MNSASHFHKFGMLVSEKLPRILLLSSVLFFFFFLFPFHTYVGWLEAERDERKKETVGGKTVGEKRTRPLALNNR